MAHKVLIMGDGWGAQAALRGVLSDDRFNISVLTNDKEIKGNYPSVNYVSEIIGDYDVCICAGWKKKIPAILLEKQQFVNIHYSLLPKYRGLHSTVWAILNDEKLLGLTIHEMTQYYDDGDIVYQYSIKNDFNKTAVWYILHFNTVIEEQLASTIDDYLTGKTKTKKQDHALASWVPKRYLEDCRICFDKPLSFQRAFFRALTHPYPLPFFEYRGNRYIVTTADFQSSNIVSKIGCIVNSDHTGIWITVKDGYVIVRNVLDSNGNNVDLRIFKLSTLVK